MLKITRKLRFYKKPFLLPSFCVNPLLIIFQQIFLTAILLPLRKLARTIMNYITTLMLVLHTNQEP